MISKLQNFFHTYLNPQQSDASADPSERARLAVAALLLEIAVSDFESADQERQVIVEIVRKQFCLDAKGADELIALAEEEHRDSTDYFQFTRLINQYYSAQQKRGLVESLWRVAVADGKLHRYEEHVIRRLSDLLYVSHTDFIAAKHRVMSAADST
jgi:uncharacterized tellurite resistance protein B-like protein